MTEKKTIFGKPSSVFVPLDSLPPSDGRVQFSVFTAIERDGILEDIMVETNPLQVIADDQNGYYEANSEYDSYGDCYQHGGYSDGECAGGEGNLSSGASLDTTIRTRNTTLTETATS